MKIKIESNGETLTIGEHDHAAAIPEGFAHASIPAEILKVAERLGAVSAGPAALPRNLADLTISGPSSHFADDMMASSGVKAISAGKSMAQPPEKRTAKKSKRSK